MLCISFITSTPTVISSLSGTQATRRPKSLYLYRRFLTAGDTNLPFPVSVRQPVGNQNAFAVY